MKNILSNFEKAELANLEIYYNRFGNNVRVFTSDNSFETLATFTQDRYSNSNIDMDYDLMQDNIFSVAFIKPEYSKINNGIKTKDLVAGTVIEQVDISDSDYKCSIYTVIDSTQFKKNKYLKILQTTMDVEMDIFVFFGCFDFEDFSELNVKTILDVAQVKVINDLPIILEYKNSISRNLCLIPLVFFEFYGLPEFSDVNVDLDYIELGSIEIVINDTAIQYKVLDILIPESNAAQKITLGIESG
jgi:hypothetical protein